MSLTSPRGSVVIAQIPPWVPPPGFYGPVPTANDMVATTPAGFTLPSLESSVHGMLKDWGSKGIIVPDWSGNPLFPGICVYNGGHTTDGRQSPLPVIFNTIPTGPGALSWTSTNIPLATDGVTPIQHPSTFPSPLMPTQIWDANVEWPAGLDETSNLGTAALGVMCQSTTPGHTYLAPVVIPAAAGGGPKGTLVYCSVSGPGPIGFGNQLPAPLHGLDLSKQFMGISRLTPPGVGWNFAPPGNPGGGLVFWYAVVYDSSRQILLGNSFNAFAGWAPNSVSASMKGWGPNTVVDTNASTPNYTKYVDGGPYGQGAGMMTRLESADIQVLWMGDGTIWAKPTLGTTAQGTGYRPMVIQGSGPVKTPSSSWPADVGLAKSYYMPDSLFAWDNGSIYGTTQNGSYGQGRVWRLKFTSGTQAQVLAGPVQWIAIDISPVAGYSFPQEMTDITYTNGQMGAFKSIPGYGVPGVLEAFIIVNSWQNNSTSVPGVPQSSATMFSVPVT